MQIEFATVRQRGPGGDARVTLSHSFTFSILCTPTEHTHEHTNTREQVGRDMQPLPKRRQELFINRLQFESPRADGRQYVSSEFIRTVTLSRAVTVSDTETLTLYELQPDGRVVGRQRVAVYLTPNPNNREGALYFETGGRAVALFDYSFKMSRSGDCVETPKGVQQCIDGTVIVPTGGGEEEED